MNCKFCLMSSSGCVYVLVTSEQFSVVSCIHDDNFLKYCELERNNKQENNQNKQIVISSIHHLHIQPLEQRIIVYFSFLLPWDTKKKVWWKKLQFAYFDYFPVYYFVQVHSICLSMLFKTHSLVDYECTWLRLFQKHILLCYSHRG
jgi:hypothetical protein